MFTIYDNEKQEYKKLEEPDPSFSYTYADYMEWNFLERLELIRGRIFKLDSLYTNHAISVMNLFFHLYTFQESKSGLVFKAPFDIRLPENGKKADDEITSVVQPDVGVICDDNKIDLRGCCGTPDLVVEGLSPTNRDHNLRTKYQLYEEAGALEYWIIDPDKKNLVIYELNKEGKYGESKIYTIGNKITSTAVSGFSINVAKIFESKFWIE